MNTRRTLLFLALTVPLATSPAAAVPTAPAATATPATPAATASAATGHLGGEAARAVFERLKGLAGPWRGRSTRGWEETGTYKVIAGGSAVLHTSFDAHPNETMVTLYTLDGDRLLLTHYCMAGNQPRLVATRASASGDEVEFTFLDGGNLPSRDRGHMDRVVMRFLDADRISSRWTWYQDGQERWLEEIESQRTAPGDDAARSETAPAPQAGSPAPSGP